MVRSAASPITPEAIDDYLARGWFRFGGTMRTTRFTVWEDHALRTTLWTRTRMHGFRWSKSNRRVLNRVTRRYRLVQRPAVVDLEHEALYLRYLEHVKGERPSSLWDLLGGPEEHRRFATRELALYAGDRLVAFSYFDEGARSIMSLAGVFDPRHARDGLGYATLALEVERARTLGLDFHYSGYVLPGESCMDYKLRIGGMEFLDVDEDRWRPWSELDRSELPDRRALRKLDAVGKALARHQIPCRRMLNPLFEIADSPMLAERMVAEPAFLMVGRHASRLPLVTWHDAQRAYQVWVGVPAVLRHRRTQLGPERTTYTALIHEEHGQHDEPGAVLATVLGLYG